MSDVFLSIPLNKIRVEETWNCRSGDLSIKQLATSIAEVGLIAPVAVVREVEGYKLIAGFRRFAAVKSLGWTHIDAKVVDLDDHASRMFNLTENLSRKSLRLYDTMRTVNDMSQKFGIRTERILKDTGIPYDKLVGMLRIWPRLSTFVKTKWALIREAEWEPSYHQLNQWSVLSHAEQNAGWTEWANDEDDPGTDFDDQAEEAFPLHKPKPFKTRRRVEVVREMIQTLQKYDDLLAQAQANALLWSIGERNKL